MQAPWHGLAFVALVPWLAALDRVGSLRAALGSALLLSVAFALAVFGWFADGMAAYTGAPRALAWGALVLLAPVLQPQLVVFALARHLASPRGGAPVRRALVGVFAWLAAEAVLPKLFGDTLGHGLHPSATLRQGADLAGAGGLTAVVLLANECVLAAVRAAVASPPRLRRGLLAASGAAALVAVLAGYGAWRLRALERAQPDAPPLRAALVQSNIRDTAGLRQRLGSYEAVRFILEEHFSLSLEALALGPVDLLIWPETVYPTTFGTPKSDDGAELDREIEVFVAETRVPLVFGGYDGSDGGGVEYNAAFLLAPDGAGPPAASAYRKAALFPLTERVPAWLDAGVVRAWLPWLGTWRPGAGPRVLPLALADGRRLRVAPLICYDAVEPRFARDAGHEGADLIVTLSNDSWFSSGQGPRLHLVVSAFRSIETRLPQLRVTNTGITAVIDATGEVRGELGVGERGFLTTSVPLARPAP
jgi:apolipoprotein N-acyltransferase